MDCRGLSAFTRVFRRAMPGNDGATRDLLEIATSSSHCALQRAKWNRSAQEASMNEPLVVRRETQIAAPPATVLAFPTDPEKILSWMGAEVTSEAHPGGLYLVKSVGDRAHVARGAFREVVPVHRLAYSFGWEGSEEVPPGSSLVEIDLIDRVGGPLGSMNHG